MRRSYEGNLLLLNRKRLSDRAGLLEVSRTKTRFSSPSLTAARLQLIGQQVKLQERAGRRRSITILLLSLILGVSLFVAVLKAIAWVYF